MTDNQSLDLNADQKGLFQTDCNWWSANWLFALVSYSAVCICHLCVIKDIKMILDCKLSDDCYEVPVAEQMSRLLYGRRYCDESKYWLMACQLAHGDIKMTIKALTTKKTKELITSRWIGMRNRSDQIDFHYFVMFKSSFKHEVVFPVSHPSTLRYAYEI